MKKGIFLAILAAALYAVNVPFSKILLNYIEPTIMAGLLYIGAGLGMGVISYVRKQIHSPEEKSLTKKQLPYIIAMVVLDILAPICLLVGLKSTTAANASLLNNFEIVATALIALFIFKEKISKRLWFGIFFVTLSCILLSVDDLSCLKFSIGSLFILLACIFWGTENNCVKMLSNKDPLQIVLLKGIFSGGGSLIIGLCIGEKLHQTLGVILSVLLLGFVAYGLSIFFYTYAQRFLGAARTSAYYAIAPFIGTALSLIIFRNTPTCYYFIALFLMIIGAWLSSSDE